MTAQLPLLAATDVAGSPSDTCTATTAAGFTCTRPREMGDHCWQHIPRPLPPLRLDSTGAAIVTAKCGTTFRVDPSDYPLVAQHRWTIDRHGYPRRWVLLAGRKPRDIRVHRDILGLALGDGQLGDHLNGDRLDNRRSNLRLATAETNAQNAGSSPYRGVSRSRSGKRFEARAIVAGHRHHIGWFDTPEEAAAAAHEWRLAHMPGYVDRRTA